MFFCSSNFHRILPIFGQNPLNSRRIIGDFASAFQ